MTGPRPPQTLRLIRGWDEILDVWPFARTKLEPSFDRSSSDTAESALASLISGEYQLWVAANGNAAAITQIVTFATGRQCNLAYLGVTGPLDEAAALLEIEAWAQMNDCKVMFIAGARLGFHRAPGWREALASYARKECFVKQLETNHGS